MDLFNDSTWPVTLAQADTSAPPASAPVDTSPPPASSGAAGEGTTATQGADGGAATDPNGQAQPSPFGSILFPMILILGVLFIFSMGSGRKEKKRRAEMLSKLAKGAKVQMVGGELGTVVAVRDDEVVVKVDENTNTSIRYTRSAVSAVTEE